MSGDLKQKIVAMRSKQDRFCREYNVSRIGVFGSFARGENRPDSDIDIMVEFSQPIDLFEFMKLRRELGEALKMEVDLVSKDAIKDRMKERILSELIYV